MKRLFLNILVLKFFLKLAEIWKYFPEDPIFYLEEFTLDFLEGFGAFRPNYL
jgi:hypothetical protein